MIDRLLANLAPHLCYGCGKTGSILCDYCKYDITDETIGVCVTCGNPGGAMGVCTACSLHIDRAWCTGWRHDALERVIDAYKFSNAKAAASSLAVILDQHLPVLPPGVVVVPIPTISRHIRQRGYDHTLLMARSLVKTRKLTTEPVLKRRVSSVQRGATRKERILQAEEAFECRTELNPDMIYLLLDDVTTTGATLRAAAKVLRGAGAENVWVAVVARQPLDR